jgi:dihydroorotate dehydrogenase electron transfer subunit
MSLSRVVPERVCAVDATVAVNEHICRDHVRLVLETRGVPNSSPGQFLELACDEGDGCEARAVTWPSGEFPSLTDSSWSGRSPYLRRPFSIADRYRDEQDRDLICVISRNIGPGTAYLDRLRVGDRLNISGPLGRGFDLSRIDRPLLLVGGGVGIPPLLYLARVLSQSGATRVTAVFGATTAGFVPLRVTADPDKHGLASPCVDLPGNASIRTAITTDDGTLGLHGRVTDAIERLAASHSGDAPLVFACGPDGMLRAVAKQTRRLGWECQLCIEKNMGCGLGTCLSCVTRVYDPSRSTGWRWGLTCTEGPVFERDRLVEYA